MTIDDTNSQNKPDRQRDQSATIESETHPLSPEERTTAGRTGAPMRGRRWTIACNYRTPADYDIPTLPMWSVCCQDGSIAFAENDDADPFIEAEKPVPVRR